MSSKPELWCGMICLSLAIGFTEHLKVLKDPLAVSGAVSFRAPLLSV